MESYYYILSSLPFLLFDGPLPLPHQEFIRTCAPWLPPRDMGHLRSARIDMERLTVGQAGHPLLKKWTAFENTVRNESVRVRAGRLGLPPEDFLRPEWGAEEGWIQRIHLAMEEADPLETEVNLLKLRWEFLSDNEVGHFYDLTALMIYGLKLQILERLKMMDEGMGKAILNTIYERNFGGY